MTGSLQVKRGIYQCVINYNDEHGKRHQKWISTGFPEKGNKRKAEKFLLDLLNKYKDEDFIQTASTGFFDYMREWLERKKIKLNYLLGKSIRRMWKNISSHTLNHST